jgi:hypothetical protein
MKMVAPGKAMVGWMQPLARSSDFTNAWEDLTAEMAADRPTIELLRQVLERPKLDFQLDYTKGVKMLLPHLAPMKRATQKLEAAAVVDLHNGDAGEALTNILTIFGLVERDRSEGLLISHMVRMAMASIAIAPTWELLQATNVTDAQLDVLQKGWEQMDFLSDATNSFAVERIWGMREVEKARATHQGYEDAFGIAASMGSSSGSSSGVLDLEAMTEKPRYAIAEVMWRSSWSYAEELHTLKSEQIILEALRAMQTNQGQCYKSDYDAMLARLSSLGITNAGEAFFRALKIPDMNGMFGDYGMSSSVRRVVQAEAARHIVVAAVALKRFQLKHGKWPEVLAELAPEFFPAVPIDPYDGKSLRYHPNADGTYLLYSIGPDGIDDGGAPANSGAGVNTANAVYYWLNNKAKDWVWPQPATEAEVKFFYDNPPK